MRREGWRTDVCLFIPVLDRISVTYPLDFPRFNEREEPTNLDRQSMVSF